MRKKIRTPEEELYSQFVLARQLVQHEAERAVIALALSSRKVAEEMVSGKIETDEGSATIREDFFGDPKMLVTFQAIRYLVKNGVPITESSIVARAMTEAREQGLEEIPQIPELMELKKLASPEGLVERGRTLDQQARLRRVIRTCCSTLYSATADKNPDDMFEQMITEMQVISSGYSSSRFLMGPEGLKAYEKSLQDGRLRFLSGLPNPFDWPWQSWNSRLRKPRPGKYFTFLSPQGFGKSTVALNMAEHWAKKGLGVCMLLVEETSEEFWERMHSHVSGIPLDIIEDRSWTSDQDALVASSKREIDGGFGNNIHILECGRYTLGQALEKAEPMVQRGRVDVLVVDYFNAFRRGGKSSDDKISQIGSDATDLVGFTMDHNIPAINFNQLTKQGEKDARKEGLDPNDEYGGVQVQQSSSARVSMERARVTDQAGEYLNGKLVANYGELSTKAKFVVHKQNRAKGYTAPWHMLFLGERGLVRDYTPQERGEP